MASRVHPRGARHPAVFASSSEQNIRSPAASQRALIGRLDRERSGPLMAALDACNPRFCRGSVVPARAGLAQQRRAWATKFEMRTTRYTTQVDELPVAHA